MKWFLILLLLLPAGAHGHEGDLDTLGCHRDQLNDGYHCHLGPLADRYFDSRDAALEALKRGEHEPRKGVQRSPGPVTLTGKASVIDGDTIEIHGKRIRLHGIDAPESSQLCETDHGKPYRCGQKAAFALADKIGRRTVSCLEKDRDRYRRIVAVCWIDAESMNAWMVLEGWAVAYRRYASDFVIHEMQAREAKRGIWAGSFMQPETWRKHRR